MAGLYSRIGALVHSICCHSESSDGGLLGIVIYQHLHKCLCVYASMHMRILRVSDQNGISLQRYIVEIYRSGQKPSMYKCMCVRSHIYMHTTGTQPALKACILYMHTCLHRRSRHSHIHI